MPYIRLLPTTSTIRHQSKSWGTHSRGKRGACIQAMASTETRACRFCGGRHRSRLCHAPIRRGWGWPGWEKTCPDLEALTVSGSPSKDMQKRMASFVDALSSTGVTSPKSQSSKPRRVRNSGGTPAKPQ